jgi:nitroreductase
MDVFKAVQKRRSIRAYLPDPVPKDTLERILEAGRLAPSARNLQPWHFIVVRDPEKRKELSAGRFATFLTQSPVVIVGCSNMRASPKWCVVDTTIAMENMVLVATGEGIGTCWIGSFDEDQVKSLLKIPEDFRVVAMLAVGYPRESLKLTRKAIQFVKPRKNIGEMVSVEEFGSPFL